MNFNNTGFSQTTPSVFVCSKLKSNNASGNLLLQLRIFHQMQNNIGTKTTHWRSGLLSLLVIFCLSLFTNKSVIAQNTKKVIETSEISGFSKISKQIVTLVAGDSANIAKETNKLQSDNIEKLNETRTRNDKIRDGVVIALPPLTNQLNDFENESQFIQIVEGSRHQTRKAKLENARINNETLFQHRLLSEKKVIALPRTPPQSGKVLHTNDSIVIIGESEMRHLSQPKNQINNIKYSNSINIGHVTPLPRSLATPGIHLQNIKQVENNAVYLKSGLRNRIRTRQESGLMTNYPPVAIPDVYTTPENTELVVSAPGHLVNDSDPDGDPLTWNSYSLPGNGTISNAATDGQFTYTPNPGFSGIESISVTISDGNGNTADGLIMILVVPEQNRNPVAVPDVYTTPENTELIVAAPGHLGNDSDPDGDPVTWNSYSLPENGTVSNADVSGQFTYTPDPGFSGIESISITISDGNGNITNGLITILVTPDQNRSPVAVPDVYTTPENTELIVAAPGHLGNDSDPDGDPVTWNSYSIPENGTMSNVNTDGQFTYTPDPDFSGIESIQVTITDGNGNVSNGLITIFVVPDQNLAPVAVPDTFTTSENTPLVVDAPGHLGNDTDPEGDLITWNSYSLPDNGTVSNANTDGQFTYTPNPGFSGIESFSITISDGNGNIATGRISITVIPSAGDAPVAVADVYSTPQNTVLNVAAPGHLGNDYDPNGDPITWSSFTSPENGMVSDANTDGQFTYTPDPGFSGIETISVTISDGNGNTANGLITILVIPDQNRVPVAIPDVYTIPENTVLNVAAPGHLGNDYDLDGDAVTWNSYSIPDNGTMSDVNTNGQFTYTPDPGFSGIESIPVTISDGNGNLAHGLVTILVIPDQNRTPIAVPDVYTIPENTALNVAAPGHLGNDYDLDGDAVTWNSYSISDNGTMSDVNTNGQFTYTPDPGFSGIESIPVTISDGNGNIAHGLVTILVIPDQNRAPIAVPDVYSTPESTPLAVEAPGHLGNDYDLDGDAVTWNSYSIPDNGTMSDVNTNGQFTYTPDPGFSGIESIPVTITDGNGNIAQGLLAFAVIKNNPPIADADEDQTVIVTQTATLDGTGSTDPDGNTLSYSWMFATEDASDPIPSGSTALLSGAETATPSFIADLPGVYSVKLIVNDGLADSDPDYVTITALSFIEALDNLIAALEALELDGTLNKGQANSLRKKIEQAQKLIDKDKFDEALDVLYGLRQHVLDLYQQDGVLTESQAMTLIAKIDEIITAIESQSSLAMDSSKAKSIKSGTGLQKEKLSSNEFALSAINPNPFRISTKIVFNLPAATNVRIGVYDMFSRKVAVLHDGYINSGKHTVILNAEGLKSGTYMVRMTTDEGFHETRRIILVR
jgi:hypothetical protein